jgi:alpha-ketoglutarate-dependent taurine dioxygenase
VSNLKIRPLRDDLPFGSRIVGVTQELLQDPSIRDELNRVFEDRGLIVFEDVEPTNAMQVALSTVFGPLKDHPVHAVDLVDPETMAGAIEVASDPAKSDIVEIDGVRYSNWLPWHFDHCYNNELNRAGVLRVLQIAPSGGLTGFMDGIDLYNAISPDLRSAIEGRSIVYTMDMQFGKIRFGKLKSFRLVQLDPAMLEIAEQARTYPRSIHPATWTRTSGETVLHVSPWMAEGIEGQEGPDGDTLLEAVCQEINRLGQSRAYFHQWEPTDMLIWDNWRMLHSVTGVSPPHPRRMQRTTIKGDYGLGRFENNDQGHYKALERMV